MKQRAWNPLSNLYDQNNVTDKKLRKDLNLFILAAALGTVFFAVSTGTPFSGLAVELGANDLFYSLLFALPIAASLMQFLASWLLEKTRQRKVIFMIGGLIQRSIWIPVALVPLFVPMSNPHLRLWSVIVLITLSSIGGSFLNVAFYSWLSDIVPMNIRGRYLGWRSSIATLLGLLSAFVASWALDQIPGMTGYMLVFGIASLFGIADIITYLWVKDIPMKQEEERRFLVNFKNVIKDKSFRPFLVFWTAWAFCWNLSGSFFAKYCLTNLGLDLTVTTLTGQVAYGLVAFLCYTWWGHKLDLHGHRWVLIRSGVVVSFLPLIWLFAIRGSYLPNLLFNLSNGIFLCSMDITSMNMLLIAMPSNNRSMYIAMYMVVTSVVGASFGYLAGGTFLELMNGFSFHFLGLVIDQYKLLFVGAGALRLLFVLLLVPSLANLKPYDAEIEDQNEKERIEENA